MRRVLAVLCLVAAIAPAYRLKAVVIDGGGRKLAGGGYACGFSTGQTVASGWLAGTGYRALLGFWNRPVPVIGIAEGEGTGHGQVAFSFAGVAPNPSAGVAAVRYSLPVATDVSLRVLDNSGREVGMLVCEVQPPGSYRVTWDVRRATRRELPNGVYFVELSAGGRRELAKAVVVR